MMLPAPIAPITDTMDNERSTLLMRGRLQNWWDEVTNSLWFLPSLFITLALLLSTLLIEVDAMLATRNSPLIPWIFSGTADAARTILSVIAGSLITVISIAISLTIVALVQVSAQWTPRILRQFTASRPNQIVLGAYAATFVYALLVLRAVRSAEQAGAGVPTRGSFVPALSVTVAMALALLCVALLIFFIHHIAASLQVSTILDRVSHDFINALDHEYSAEPGSAASDPPSAMSIWAEHTHAAPPQHLCADQAGFLRRIDEDALLAATTGLTPWMWVRPQIGDFVAHGGVLVEYVGEALVDEGRAERIRAACILAPERTTTQDPLFAIRQIVDIALRALSPGINDMTTAEYALWHLGDMLGRLAARPFPPSERRTADGRTGVLLSRPSWDMFVAAAFNQIRRAGQDDVHVTLTVLAVLAELGPRVPAGPRRDALHRQLREIRHALDQALWSPVDAAELHSQAHALDRALTAGKPHHSAGRG
jgi:uncharacterized membrane protein